MPAPRVCTVPGCPALVRGTSRCPTHAAPNSTARGYGAAHRRLREQWRTRVERGGVSCARCGEPIKPDAEWHLGHDDHDRSVYRGPEHARECNLSAAGRAAHGLDPRVNR